MVEDVLIIGTFGNAFENICFTLEEYGLSAPIIILFWFL